MPRPAAPVLLFGTERVGGPDPERQLDALASIWVEATELGKALRPLEQKIAAQSEWLDAHRGHERWGAYVVKSWDVRKEHERLMHRLHGLAKDANKLAAEMTPETKDRARSDIHAWACLGAVGVEAMAWDLVPSDEWLNETDG